MAPAGPHIHVQKLTFKIIAKGLIVSLTPMRVGVTKFDSIKLKAMKIAGTVSISTHVSK